MPRTAFFHTSHYLTAPNPARPVTRPVPARDDGREHVLFESLVAFVALLLIITGFSLYVGRAFADTPATSPTGSTTIQIEAQAPAEPPFSPAEV